MAKTKRRSARSLRADLAAANAEVSHTMNENTYLKKLLADKDAAAKAAYERQILEHFVSTAESCQMNDHDFLVCSRRDTSGRINTTLLAVGAMKDVARIIKEQLKNVPWGTDANRS